MLSVPVIVNHVSDERKQNGLVTNTYQYLGQTPEGEIQLLNINMVIWPDLPTPLHHQEADSDLEFVSVYDATSDYDDTDDEEDEDGIEFTDDETDEDYTDSDDNDNTIDASAQSATVLPKDDAVDAEAPNN